MKKESLFLQIIYALFIVLFLYTGTMKLIDHQTFEFDLLNAPYINKVWPIAYIVVPIIELLTAIMLLFSRTQRIGIRVSLALMIIFTIYVGGILAIGGRRPCTCGGVIREMDWNTHLYFNIGFAILAFIGVLLSRKSIYYTYGSSKVAN